jgi:hypothetical protein
MSAVSERAAFCNGMPERFDANPLGVLCPALRVTK